MIKLPNITVYECSIKTPYTKTFYAIVSNTNILGYTLQSKEEALLIVSWLQSVSAETSI